MHTALSVILFTVLSGAGLGALALVALADLASGAGGSGLPVPWTRAAMLGLLFLIAGLCCSTLHLANPKNAWRSATRFRTSWLSREAVFALALLVVAAAYVAARQFGAAFALRIILALATAALAWTVLYCTAMIYASLKPIRAWHTARVPLAFLLLGHASGALLVAAVLAGYGLTAPFLTLLAAVLFVTGALAKLDYWRYLTGGEGAVTIEQAIGVRRGVGPGGDRSVMAARLLDAGHSRGTFLTREFVVTQPERLRRLARATVLLAGFAVPLVWLAAGLPEWRGAALALGACLVGFGAERWLFFAEARHTVRLFHGDRRT
jgi:DMSO reductase anchor subunit